jgi:hypothetical protein
MAAFHRACYRMRGKIRAVRRRLFNIASAVSLVLGVLYAALDVYVFVLSDQAQIVWQDNPQKHFRIVRQGIATVGVLAILPAFWLRGTFRRKRAARRRLQGECRTCGYNLTANTSGICSECGTTVKP